jgi:hypothetical protein
VTVVRGLQMCNLNEWIVREAFLAYDRGDVAAMMDLVDAGRNEARSLAGIG